jgi:phosphate starvation-inducible protein PhoH and related proteins
MRAVLRALTADGADRVDNAGARQGEPLTEVSSSRRRGGGTAEPPAGGRTQVKIVIPDEYSMVSLLGSGDELLHVIERASGADVHVRGNEITVTGEPAENTLITALFEQLIELLASGAELSADTVERSVGMLRRKSGVRPADVLTVDILSSRGRTIRPKTLNQKRYVDAIDNHTIVFAIGPAGTGKTYLAMAKAVKALQDKEVNRIILTRPAVEAGERLGFLPGTLFEKIDPYLRPLYDALHDMLDPDSIPRLTAAGTIEIAPLAYMRGRSLRTDTPVLTPDGFRPIGSLTIGDLVIGSNGEPTSVIGVFPQGEKDIYRLTTQDGASTLCSGDHLWAVATRDDRRRGKPLRVLSTREMIGNLRANHYHRYELPLHSAPVCFPYQDVPMDPYALGLLLGDGCLTGFTTPSRVRSSGEVITIENPDPARQLGLAGCRSETNFVPASYRFNSADVRLGVLQGLLDSDGEPLVQRERTCRIQYTTTSQQLRDDAVFLVRSLGGVAHTRLRHDAYIIDIRLPAGIEPFRLTRKREKYNAQGGCGRPMRFIESIEPAGTAEAVCISVAAADSLYTTEDFLLTHNTLNDSFIILDEAQNTSAEQMKMFLTRLGFGSQIVVTGDVTQVDLPHGQVSGLRQVQDILEGLDDIHFARLTSQDVVRHRLVGEIVDAYARHDARQETRDRGSRGTGRAGR